MRCLTLANALNRHGAEVRFVCQPLPKNLSDLLRSHGHALTIVSEWASETEANASGEPDKHSDALATISALSDQSWDWLVVDHYHLGKQWESTLRNTASHVLVIDDLANRDHDCDLLLDQNLINESSASYETRVPENCRLLLGTQFALIRDEFSRARKNVAARKGPANRLLVCFGGMDSENYTGRTLDSLRQVAALSLAVDVIIGAAHPNRSQIAATCLDAGYSCHVQPDNMAELIAAADVAIGAGGSMTWERCCLGLPTVTLAIADNQRRVILDAAAEGLLYALPGTGNGIGDATRHLTTLIENPMLRQHISQRALGSVDGRGADRVAAVMIRPKIELRQATAADAADLFNWRGHPAVREKSLQSTPLDWQTHVAWLNSVLDSPTRDLLIGSAGKMPVGVVRFDIQGREAIVSIYRVPGSGVYGVASSLLQNAEQWLAEHRPEVHMLRATVLRENVRSHQLFSRAGYKIESTDYVKRLG